MSISSRTAVRASAALVMIAGLSACGLFTPDPRATAAPQTSPAPVIIDAEASPPASVAASGPASSSPPTAKAPDGRIDDPLSATYPLPAWPGNPDCPSGPTKFTDRVHRGPGDEESNTVITRAAYADIDNDGALETVALFVCRLNRSGVHMVVAFDKDARGKVISLGIVLRSWGGRVAAIDDIRDAGKTVELHVASASPCCATVAVDWQWRAYALRDGAFTQVGGPSKFPSPRPQMVAR